jgi:hypothetical protein
MPSTGSARFSRPPRRRRPQCRPQADVLTRNNVTVSGRAYGSHGFARRFGCDQYMWRFVAPVGGLVPDGSVRFRRGRGFSEEDTEELRASLDSNYLGWSPETMMRMPDAGFPIEIVAGIRVATGARQRGQCPPRSVKIFNAERGRLLHQLATRADRGFRRPSAHLRPPGCLHWLGGMV